MLPVREHSTIMAVLIAEDYRLRALKYPRRCQPAAIPASAGCPGRPAADDDDIAAAIWSRQTTHNSNMEQTTQRPTDMANSSSHRDMMFWVIVGISTAVRSHYQHHQKDQSRA